MSNEHKLALTPINHILFVLDASGSMRDHQQEVVRVVDEQVKTLAKRSQEMNQETRVSIYIFRGKGLRGNELDLKCVVYDRDVLRLPSLAGHYTPDGGTPLCRAALMSINELQQTPELHADHAFLAYFVTDGEETENDPHIGSLLKQLISGLKENWTVAALVPDHKGVTYCRNLGFSAGNIVTWDVNSATGVNDAGKVVTQATQSYMTMRSQGVRSTKNLFTAEVKAKRTEVTAKLKPVSNPYQVFALPTTATRQQIKDFVEAKTGANYMVGAAYYQLVKPEVIQGNKQICLRTVPDGRLFSGSLDEVRSILGLPAGGDIKVVPGEIKDFVVFVQSTSVNRNVIPGQEVLVLKL